MYSKLFHKDVFMPEGIREKSEFLQKSNSGFVFSRHFIERCSAREDRSHDYFLSEVARCLETLASRPREAFEVEFGKDYHYFGEPGWHILKICVRIPYGANQDVCVALSPNYREGKPSELFVRTAWLNSAEDSHYTLDRSKYCDEDEWLASI